MIIADKKAGETPLQFLSFIREQNPELKDEKLSYAGRLDPMAEGQMLVLVGDENKEYKKYLGFDKEYVATFLIGTETDTGDALGLLRTLHSALRTIDKGELKNQATKLSSVTKQTYPWFSAQTVNGKKLFDHYKEGNLDIERPTRSVSIKEVEFMGTETHKPSEIKKYIFETIGKVEGEFRQTEILEKWTDFFDQNREQKLQTFQVRLLVSSGTYIRALTEQFDFPVMLLKLRRTCIRIDDAMKQ